MLQRLRLAIPMYVVSAFALAAGEQPPTPKVDHHMHLFSPARAAKVYVAPRPAVELPAPLARVLAWRERHWDDAEQLERQFTGDALLLNQHNEDLASWIDGSKTVAEEMSVKIGRPHRITPIRYRISGDTAYIAGYYSRDVDGRVRNFGHTMLVLRKKGADWRIAVEVPVFPGPPTMLPNTAEDLVKQLDAAGASRGVVLSTAYQWGGPDAKDDDAAYAEVKMENDYTATEVARFPTRLVAFCSFDPLKSYAEREIARCAADPRFTGFKLHFGNSYVDLRKPEHARRIGEVFRLINEHRKPVIVHLWTSPEFEQHGGDSVRAFLDHVLPLAPDSIIQIAHMAGGGRSTDSAMEVFAGAISAGKAPNVYFDVATLTEGQSDDGLVADAERMRAIGMKRFLFGADAAPPNPVLKDAWATFRMRMPLTAEEIKTIANNVAPYL